MLDTRVAVFIDYQNVYHCARDQFFPSSDNPSPLAGVRVYRDQPDSRSGLKLSRSFDRQVTAWEADAWRHRPHPASELSPYLKWAGFSMHSLKYILDEVAGLGHTDERSP